MSSLIYGVGSGKSYYTYLLQVCCSTWKCLSFPAFWVCGSPRCAVRGLGVHRTSPVSVQ